MTYHVIKLNIFVEFLRISKKLIKELYVERKRNSINVYFLSADECRSVDSFLTDVLEYKKYDFFFFFFFFLKEKKKKKKKERKERKNSSIASPLEPQGIVLWAYF